MLILTSQGLTITAGQTVTIDLPDGWATAGGVSLSMQMGLPVTNYAGTATPDSHGMLDPVTGPVRMAVGTQLAASASLNNSATYFQASPELRNILFGMNPFFQDAGNPVVLDTNGPGGTSLGFVTASAPDRLIIIRMRSRTGGTSGRADLTGRPTITRICRYPAPSRSSGRARAEMATGCRSCRAASARSSPAPRATRSRPYPVRRAVLTGTCRLLLLNYTTASGYCGPVVRPEV